jgi:hypothetical protein
MKLDFLEDMTTYNAVLSNEFIRCYVDKYEVSRKKMEVHAHTSTCAYLNANVHLRAWMSTFNASKIGA